MNEPTSLETRLDRLEALNLNLREQLTQQAEHLEKLSLEVARVERAMLSNGAELMAGMLELRTHLVDLTLDGYYPTRLPPVPLEQR
ncbi:MAG: hypothetical protein JNK82_26730 [Myxococcaceae bacterium]|nr:hypothetical protein [Myxococcaceae bacterium]